MTIKELIEHLQTFPETDVVYHSNSVGYGQPISKESIFYDVLNFGNYGESVRKELHLVISS